MTGHAGPRVARWGRTVARPVLRAGWLLVRRLVGAERAGRILASMPRPASPVAQRWELSLATVVGRHPRVPRLVARGLRRFDKYGRVVITPDRVGFDGKTVRWSRVIEVRVCPTAGPPPQPVLQREVARV